MIVSTMISTPVLWLCLIRGAQAAGIVHLFEWKFDDVAKECERFLGPYGYDGVQVSPVNEVAVIKGRPWWERYQPFSYRIISRSGDEDDFKTMCSRCSKAGIKIYVDVVFNHMSANQPTGTVGTGGSVPITANKSYPDVPYTTKNFHPTCTINDYQNVTNVRNCELVGLHDLNHSQDFVRDKISEFLNKLIDLGASGFRVDAAKHMWPSDLKGIYSRVKKLPSGERPFIFQEVIDQGGEPIHYYEYTGMSLVTEFRYGRELSRAFKGSNQLKWLKNFGEAWNLMNSKDALVFIDNHDNQRGSGGGGDVLTYKQAKRYKMAVGFMLAWPYGTPRIMSSFYFTDRDQGPPARADGTINEVIVKADLTCSNGWVCEHRWRPIYSMVQFANLVKGAVVSFFSDNGSNQISFCRGNKGFIAFNGDGYDMNEFRQTCLPPGTYCDIITGSNAKSRCTGKSVVVNDDGLAKINIKSNETEGLLAIHLNSRLESIVMD